MSRITWVFCDFDCSSLHCEDERFILQNSTRLAQKGERCLHLDWALAGEFGRLGLTRSGLTSQTFSWQKPKTMVVLRGCCLICEGLPCLLYSYESGHRFIVWNFIFFFSKLISFYNHSLSSGITRRKELKCGWYFWWRCSTLWLSHCQNDVCTWCCFCTLETASQNLDESKGFEWCWGWAMKLEKITNIALWDWMF